MEGELRAPTAHGRIGETTQSKKETGEIGLSTTREG